MSRRPKVIYAEIPPQHTYQEVWDLQKHLHQKLISKKRSGVADSPGYLLLCQHQPVFTLGKSGKFDHLKVSLAELEDQNTEFYKTNRGGDITYHGPGQITGYPILDLDQYYNDVHRYVRELEEVVIRTIATYGLEGTRIPGYSGVWIQDQMGRRKICAIGVHMSRWVTLHGFALNVFTDLTYFEKIIPCGIQDPDTSVTNMSKECQREIDPSEVMSELKQHFSKIFDWEWTGKKQYC